MAPQRQPKTLRHIRIGAAIILVSQWPGFADPVVLTSGTSGSLTGFPQSYNENRGVDVTVLSGLDLAITSMTLYDLGIGGATSAYVGARIYNSGDGSLLASGEVTVFRGGRVTVPISATLLSSGNYRVTIYVATDPKSKGSATLFDPDPPGLGGFPYTEATGLLRINNAWDIATDSFPTNWNIYVPQITLEATLCTHLNVYLVNSNALVQWPAAASNVVLEATPDLTDPSAWVTVTNAPALVGTNWVVTNHISGDSRFYRLR
jgi:hypothetical protein